MSELTDQIRRMLVQAQEFEGPAPLEAMERARLAVAECSAALSSCVPEEHGELSSLLALARARHERYQRGFERFTADAEARAAAFQSHERAHLTRPLPAKV